VGKPCADGSIYVRSWNGNCDCWRKAFEFRKSRKRIAWIDLTFSDEYIPAKEY